jgi:hypothetical protein
VNTRANCCVIPARVQRVQWYEIRDWNGIKSLTTTVQIVRVSCLCTQSPVQARRCESKHWTCERVCARPLACTVHTCAQTCHAGVCTPCTRESVRTCRSATPSNYLSYNCSDAVLCAPNARALTARSNARQCARVHLRVADTHALVCVIAARAPTVRRVCAPAPTRVRAVRARTRTWCALISYRAVGIRVRRRCRVACTSVLQSVTGVWESR